VQTIEVSRSGEYIVAASENGTFTVIDLVTQMVTSYRGHGARLTAFSAPTTDCDYFISADVYGTIRTWPLPRRIAHVIGNTRTRFTSAIYSNHNDTAIAATYLPELTIASPSRGVRVLSPHLDNDRYLEISNNGDHFAAYGTDKTVELWSTRTWTRERLLETSSQSISRVAFINDEDLIIAGRDGQLVHWTAAGNHRSITTFANGIFDFILIPRTSQMIVGTTDGAVWRVSEYEAPVQLRPAGTTITRMVYISDDDGIGIGFASGETILINRHSWQSIVVFRASGSVRDVTSASGGRIIAVSDSGGAVHVGRKGSNTWSTAHTVWSTFNARARRILFAPNGLLIVLSADGAAWLHSPTADSWIYVSIGATDSSITAVSDNSKHIALYDWDGRII